MNHPCQTTVSFQVVNCKAGVKALSLDSKLSWRHPAENLGYVLSTLFFSLLCCLTTKGPGMLSLFLFVLLTFDGRVQTWAFLSGVPVWVPDVFGCVCLEWWSRQKVCIHQHGRKVRWMLFAPPSVLLPQAISSSPCRAPKKGCPTVAQTGFPLGGALNIFDPVLTYLPAWFCKLLSLDQCMAFAEGFRKETQL